MCFRQATLLRPSEWHCTFVHHLVVFKAPYHIGSHLTFVPTLWGRQEQCYHYLYFLHFYRNLRFKEDKWFAKLTKMENFKYRVKANQPWAPVRLFKTIKLVVRRQGQIMNMPKNKNKSNTAFQYLCLLYCFQISFTTVSPRAKHTAVTQSTKMDNGSRSVVDIASF